MSLDQLAEISKTINPVCERKILYIPGMGSKSKSLASLLVQVYGATIGKSIADIVSKMDSEFLLVKMVTQAYVYVSNNYEDGDNIW